MQRRSFLRGVVAASAGLGVGAPTRGWAAEAGPVVIEHPIQGAVLNRRHGTPVEGGLRIQVKGTAPPGLPVTVNGVIAGRDGERFAAEIVLRDPVADIAATSGGRRQSVRVRWDRHSFPRYRFSIDDNSFFLRDIAEKKYKSLFDSFYLAMLRDMHRKYGAKFVLNIYYTTADEFDLTKFPDRYKSEWIDNATWLSLSFHAHANDPPRPYQDAPPEQLIADWDKVAAEIRRFAGEATYSVPTVIHYAMVRPEALKPLASRGVRVLSGLFRRQGDGWDINYRLANEISEYLSQHDAWHDFESGITFSKVDLVANNTPVDRVAPTLEPLAADPNQAEIMDLFTHEQYFWPFYSRYVPDHAQRVETAIRWVTERGHKPVVFHEGFLGAPD